MAPKPDDEVGADGLCGRVAGRGGMIERWRSARALLIAALVMVGWKGLPASTGGTGRDPGTIGVMPGGGGGTDTGRLPGG